MKKKVFKKVKSSCALCGLLETRLLMRLAQTSSSTSVELPVTKHWGSDSAQPHPLLLSTQPNHCLPMFLEPINNNISEESSKPSQHLDLNNSSVWSHANCRSWVIYEKFRKFATR